VGGAGSTTTGDRPAETPAAAPSARRATPGELRRVFVRAPNWIGDAVMALGGLREIRRIVGDAHLAVAARPWVAGIYEESGVVDEVIPLERRGWRDAFAAASALRSRRFDVAVLFQNAFEAALVARLARVPRVIGFPTDARALLLTDRVRRDRAHALEHQSRSYMRIAAGFERSLAGRTTVEPDRADCSLLATPETVARAGKLLRAHGLRAGVPLAVLNPGATNSRAKRWMPDRFAAVGDSLCARHGMQVAIVGSEGDLEVAELVARHSSSQPAILAGRTNVRDLIGVLAHASVLVSNDTGPAHLGAALGVPTVTIFGPTEQFATHPVGPSARTVSHPVHCSPCMQRDCPIDHRCMTRLETSAVLEAVDAALGPLSETP
jgi:heptosyltransferase-2